VHHFSATTELLDVFINRVEAFLLLHEQAYAVIVSMRLDSHLYLLQFPSLIVLSANVLSCVFVYFQRSSISRWH